LPTEAQWEYACRAGTTTVFHYGNSLSSRQANFRGYFPYGGASKGPYLGKTTSVGSYSANAWGLYDMHGNVWEWCQDKSDTYPSEAVVDPIGKNGSYCIRGGSWSRGARHGRSALRNRFTPGYRNSNLGLRLVLVPSS
jgi:formylglycine-generating enzyme required for sulfatase activity